MWSLSDVECPEHLHVDDPCVERNLGLSSVSSSVVLRLDSVISVWELSVQSALLLLCFWVCSSLTYAHEQVSSFLSKTISKEEVANRHIYAICTQDHMSFCLTAE